MSVARVRFLGHQRPAVTRQGAADEVTVTPSAPPAGVVLLSEVLAGAADGQWPAAGFLAWVRGPFADGSTRYGAALSVTAVLDRTAVVEVEFGDRRLARHDVLLVDPADVRWVERVAPVRLFYREPRAAQAGEGVPGDDRPPAPVAPSPVQPAAAPASAARTCGRCDRRLPAQNRSGVCVSCQRTCPVCSGAKSIASPQCRRCARSSRTVTTTEAGTATVAELAARVQDLVDQVVAIGRYASELEIEIDRCRAELRRARRIGQRARAALARARARRGGGDA